MAVVPDRRVTVEEFRNLPQDNDAVYRELRHGRVACVTRPKLGHLLLQRRVCRLLKALAASAGRVDMDVVFRALPEHELRIAEVAYIAARRAHSLDLDDNLHGVRISSWQCCRHSRRPRRFRQRKNLP